MKKKLIEILLSEKCSVQDLENRLTECYGLKRKDLPPVKQRSGGDAPEEALMWLLTAHEKLTVRKNHLPCVEAAHKPGMRPEAAALVQELDDASFQHALRTLTDLAFRSKSSSRRMYLSFPVFRYADEDLMQDACDRMRQWQPTDWGEDLAPKKTFGQAALYSETTAAMLYLDEQGALKTYAALRNTDEDSLRDQFLRDAAENRNEKLLRDFLSGRERPADGWKRAYLPDSVLRAAAGTLVWAQGGRTFTLTAADAIDCAGNAYTITDEAIKVAHPMEMPPDEVTAWQKQFASREIRQPFLQIWEPVRSAEQIRPDRYAGCSLPIGRFADLDSHGVHGHGLRGIARSYGFTLDGCELNYQKSISGLNFDGVEYARFILGEFHFPAYTRQVNHIVSLLDTWTTAELVRKDDVSSVDRLDAFTLAQITEFIQAAQEASATNVLAALLEYKNTRFADFDPMDEFTLEW